MKNFMEGFLFRPQGKPMAYPYTPAAQISQFPWRHIWHEAWFFRYPICTAIFLVIPLYYQIDKKLTGPENTALWREKRKKDAEHRQHELAKMWEVRT